MARVLSSILIAFTLALAVAVPRAGQAQSTFSGLPAATVPLGSVGDAVPLDQGAGCATNALPCVTSKASSVRIGQPVVLNCATVSSPFTYQPCIDTSTTLPTLKAYFDGVWSTIGTYDTTTGIWTPPVGGGTATLASAATTDLGSVPQAAVTISGSVTIASLGTATAGTVRFLTFSGSPTLTYNATTLILPGQQDLSLTPGATLIAQSLGAGAWRIGFSAPPKMPLNVYVAPAPAGNDANSCLTALAACATANHAIAAATSLGLSAGQSLIVNFAAGAYTQTVFVNQPIPGSTNTAPNPNGTNSQPGQVLLQGAGASITTLNGGAYCSTISASNYAVIGVRAFTLLGTGAACQSTLFAQIGGTINIYDDIIFGTANIEHIHIENAGSSVQGWYSYTIAGNSTRHILAASNGLYIHSAFPTGIITFTGGPVFSNAFAVAAENGTIQFNADVTFSPAAVAFTGKRFHAYDNGVIATYPSTSLTWIPGNTSGTTDTGGIYDGDGSVAVAVRPGSGKNVTIVADGAGIISLTANGNPITADSPIISTGTCAAQIAGGSASLFQTIGANCDAQVSATLSGGFVQLAVANAVAFNASAISTNVNNLQANAANAGSGPDLTAVGASTNISIGLVPKNAGIVTITNELAITALADTTSLAVTGYSLDGTDTHPLVSFAGTLNTTGVAIVDLLSITCTACGSAFMEKRFGGAGGVTPLRTLDMVGNQVLAGYDDAASFKAGGTPGIASCTVVTAGATITITGGIVTAFTGC